MQEEGPTHSPAVMCRHYGRAFKRCAKRKKTLSNVYKNKTNQALHAND